MVSEWRVNSTSLSFPSTSTPDADIPFEPNSVAITNYGPWVIRVSFGPQRTDDLTLTPSTPTQAVAVGTRARKIYIRCVSGPGVDPAATVQINASKAR